MWHGGFKALKHHFNIFYPLVIYSGFSHWKWWFSIAMLNYQMVHVLWCHAFVMWAHPMQETTLIGSSHKWECQPWQVTYGETTTAARRTRKAPDSGPTALPGIRAWAAGWNLGMARQIAPASRKHQGWSSAWEIGKSTGKHGEITAEYEQVPCRSSLRF